MPDASRPLPAHPSVEQLKKQAKDLLRDAREGNAAALDRVRRVIPRLAERDSAGRLKLADAQFVLAREYGFESWARLAERVDDLQPPGLRPYQQLAETLANAYMTGDADAIRRVNAEQETSFVHDRDPEKMQRRLTMWFASETRSSDLALADARFLVARKFHFESWEDLVASVRRSPAVASSRAGHPVAPFYRIDSAGNAIHLRGPVSDKDWDVVIGVIADRKIAGLHAGGQMSDAALQRVSRLEGVTRLFLGGSQRLTDAGLRHLANMPQLEALELGGWDCSITDRGLEVLDHLRRLERFQMGWAQRISDAGASHLQACDQLEVVNLMGTPTGDGAIRALAGKPNVREFKTGRAVTDAGLPLLHGFPIFKTWRGGEVRFDLMSAGAAPNQLMVDGRFTNKGLASLAGLDGLFAFSVFWHTPAVTGEGLAALAGLPNLHLLGWGGTLCDDEAMRHIGAMPRLRKLMAQGTIATDVGFEALSHSRSIEYIWGRECPNLTGRGFASLAAMPALQGLAVSCRRVDDAALGRLPTFPRLRQMMPMDVSDDGFRHVGRCEQLEGLWCMYCQDTGDAATSHIKGLARLKTYYAGSTRITDRSLELLGGMTSLEEISLWDCVCVTNAGIAALASLPRLRKLTIEGLPQVTQYGARVFRPDVHVSYSG